MLRSVPGQGMVTRQAQLDHWDIAEDMRQIKLCITIARHPWRKTKSLSMLSASLDAYTELGKECLDPEL